MRDKPFYDGAVPSGNSVAALNLFRLGRMTGDHRLEERGERILKVFSGRIVEYPSAFTQWLNALDFAIGPGREVVLVGNARAVDFKGMLEAVHRTFAPRRVLVGCVQGAEGRRVADLCPYVESMTTGEGGGARIYVCENYACRNPIDDLDELRRVLGC
mgnify:CR=1 FL=1